MYQDILSAAAQKHGLPVELLPAMAQVESTNNPWAARYEPGFFARYIAPLDSCPAPAGCSDETERRMRATSWGLMQVMGQTAREHGFEGWLPELCDPAVGVEYGCLYLARQRKRVGRLGWDAVCAAYNGGLGAVKGFQNFSNPEYPRKVLKALGGVWPRM